jgi:hypothetical protein
MKLLVRTVLAAVFVVAMGVSTCPADEAPLVREGSRTGEAVGLVRELRSHDACRRARQNARSSGERRLAACNEVVR